MSTKTWNGSNADWTTPADWSGGTLPASTDDAVINSGTATIGATDAGITVKSVTLSGASASLVVADPGQTQTVTGNVSNAGTLDVDLTGAGGSTLSIGGTLTNSASGADGVFIGNAGITQATAVSIGGLANTGTITIAGGFGHTPRVTLTLTGSGLAGGTIDMNSFADLVVDGTLTLQGGTINGGTLTATAGGGVTDNAFGGTLNGVTISTGTTYTDSNGTTTTLEGTITNNGEISVDDTGSGTTLSIAASGATLTGNGTVVLSNSVSQCHYRAPVSHPRERYDRRLRHDRRPRQVRQSGGRHHRRRPEGCTRAGHGHEQ